MLTDMFFHWLVSVFSAWDFMMYYCCCFELQAVQTYVRSMSLTTDRLAAGLHWVAVRLQQTS